MALLPFEVALLTIVRNDLAIAWSTHTGGKAYCSQIHFNATNKGRISIKFAKTVSYISIFRRWTGDFKKKASIPLVQVVKKELWLYSTDLGTVEPSPPN